MAAPDNGGVITDPHRLARRFSGPALLALAALVLAPTTSRLLASVGLGWAWASLCSSDAPALPHAGLDACSLCSLAQAALAPPAKSAPALPPAQRVLRVPLAGTQPQHAADSLRMAQARAPPRA